MAKEKKETPRATQIRLYEKHRKMIEKVMRRDGISQAEVIRRALEAYCV